MGGSDLHLKEAVHPVVRVNGLLSYLEDYEALRKEDAEAILEDIIPEILRGELPLAPSWKVLPFVHLRQLHDREPEPFDSMNDADELVKVYRLDNVDIGDGSAAGRQAHSLRRGGSCDGADLTNARVSEEQLREAEYLEGATMPDGQKYEVWLKSKGSREDGENAGAS